jgi:hypothetical protein
VAGAASWAADGKRHPIAPLVDPGRLDPGRRRGCELAALAQLAGELLVDRLAPLLLGEQVAQAHAQVRRVGLTVA